LAAVDRRVYAAVTLVAILVVLAVGGTLGYAVYRDAQPTSPALNLKSGQKEVPLDQKLVLTLARPAPTEAVSTAFHISPAVEGHLGAAADRRTFTWTSIGPWADLSQYTVRFDQVNDDRKIAIHSATWSFTTTIVPRITALTNDAGVAIADDADLPVGTSLHISFNEAMDPQSVKLLANGNPVPLTWEAQNDKAAFGTQGIAVGPLALTLGDGGKDLLGHALPTGWKLTPNLVFKVTVHTVPLRAPALVQIPNDPGAWDQSGLQAADMVFESVAEGGITRFTALFTNVPDKVGPVRSGRLISIKLTKHYRGMLFLSGTSEGTFGVLSRSGIPAVFDTYGVYYRTSDHRAPDNLYINGDAVQRSEGSINEFRPPMGGRPGLSGGSEATDVSVPEHSSTYHLDAATKTYQKTESGHQMGDAALGQPLRLSMLIVLRTHVTTTGIIEDSNGARGLDYDLDGSGPADIYYQGQKYEAKWGSTDPSSPIVFTNDAGQPIALPSGLVWVDAIPG
jgi:hypothetical protein